MKLNADILFDYLTQHVSAEMRGLKKLDCELSRPLFHTDLNAPFEANKLYVSRVDKLPSNPRIEDGVVIIVVGQSMHAVAYESRCCVIRITDSSDIFEVFNCAQEVFDLFDAYEDEVGQVIRSTANVQQIVNLSSVLLEATVLVLDAKFNVLAQNALQPGALLGMEELELFLANESLMMSRRDPIPISILDKDLLCMNLYDHDEYLGSITLDFTTRNRRNSDSALIALLARFIVAAIARLPREGSLLSDIKRGLADLLDGMSISDDDRRNMHQASSGRRFLCLKMTLGTDMAALPFAYICSEIEAQYPGSFAFPRNGAVVAAVDVSECSQDGGIEALEEALSEFSNAVNAHVGLSDAFSDLANLRLYYDQAAAALSRGIASRASERVHYFQDFALMQLVANAFGNAPVEMYLTEGLRKLVAHDEASSLSYLETLQAYLDNNLSMTRAASALFVHRSTLIDRISRIEKELDLDLNNPDDRLRLQIVLKGLQARSSFGS